MSSDGLLTRLVDFDMLLLNIEAATRVNRRTDFFSWVQGVFQGMIAHEVLICGLAFPGMSGLAFEWLGSYPLGAEPFAELCSPDRGFLHRAVKLWQARGCAPFLVTAGGDAADREGDAQLQTDLAHWLFDNLLVHGLPGLDGRPAGFFALAKIHGAPGERETQLIALLMPYLYAGWLRANCSGGSDAYQGDRGPLLTVRELEILGWMHKGKSNAEIGQILSISQLTVKNHVQKILRKLGAHNRTQAVAKGLSLCITR